MQEPRPIAVPDFYTSAVASLEMLGEDFEAQSYQPPNDIDRKATTTIPPTTTTSCPMVCQESGCMKFVEFGYDELVAWMPRQEPDKEIKTQGDVQCRAAAVDAGYPYFWSRSYWRRRWYPCKMWSTVPWLPSKEVLKGKHSTSTWIRHRGHSRHFKTYGKLYWCEDSNDP